ncbi:ABC transporter ATP-binding protein [Frigoribacterium salinisoli]
MVTSSDGLVVDQLVAAIGTRHLWGPLDVRVPPGGSLAVVGPNGSGKSSLLACLGGLRPPQSGSVRWRGTTLTGARRRTHQRFLRDDCGIVLQEGSLVPDWTVRRNVDVVRPRGVSRRERARRVEGALTRLGLADRGPDVLTQLSGGERQRATAARLLVQQPSLVVADEMTSALDPEGRRSVLDALASLRDRGAVVVLATHDDAVTRWCGQFLELPGGDLHQV